LAAHPAGPYVEHSSLLFHQPSFSTLLRLFAIPIETYAVVSHPVSYIVFLLIKQSTFILLLFHYQLALEVVAEECLFVEAEEISVE